MRILVATEIPEERKLIGDALGRRDDVEKVIFAEDGVDAYIMLRNESLDLVIVSGTLRRIDGVVLVRTIGRATYARHVRTILILGQEQAEDLRDVLSARPTAIVVRPFDGDHLLRRVEAAMTKAASGAIGA